MRRFRFNTAFLITSIVAIGITAFLVKRITGNLVEENLVRTGEYMGGLFLIVFGFILVADTIILRATRREITLVEEQSRVLAGANEQLQAEISDRRRAQESLLQRSEELSRVNEDLRNMQDRLVRTERLAAIGELAAGVAHELRNPLGGIKNAVFYIKTSLAGSQILVDNPMLGEFLELMDTEIESSNQIITDLIDFSRVNLPHLTATKLETVVDDALSRVGVKGNVNVIKKLGHDPPDVLADGNELRRAFGNLIRNADEAMPEGGTLTISAKVADEFVEVHFRDTGIGISDADLPKILDPLFTTKAKGTGMGLAIVNRTMERHDGSLDVSTKQGEGTTFTLRLHRKIE